MPLPSSPTNIPPAPVVKSSESSVTSSGTDDIHGLVNYIEGNSALNKMELAEKKAAKKARQRQKKVNIEFFQHLQIMIVYFIHIYFIAGGRKT